ncbi:MAG: hypothetical protein ABJO27_18630 [Pseudoruegeria sp.]
MNSLAPPHHNEAQHTHSEPNKSDHQTHPPFSVLLNGHSYTGQSITLRGAEISGPLKTDCFGETCTVQFRFSLYPVEIGLTFLAIVLPNSDTFGGVYLKLSNPTDDQIEVLTNVLRRTGTQPDLLDHFLNNLPTPSAPVGWKARTVSLWQRLAYQ